MKKHPPIKITQDGLSFLEMGGKNDNGFIPYNIRILKELEDGDYHQFEEIKNKTGLEDRIWNSCYVSLRVGGYIEKLKKI
ncbi:MAG: hypothetical protein AABY22_27420 [Nanoarchaeota archaeon]